MKACDKTFNKIRISGKLKTKSPETSRKQRADDPQGPIFGLFILLIFINDLLEGLKSNPKLFADDKSFFLGSQ